MCRASAARCLARNANSIKFTPKHPTHSHINTFGRQCTTTSTPPPQSPSLLKTLATGYVTLLGANFISNMMIHPTQKLDYGVLNAVYPDNREVINHGFKLAYFLFFWGVNHLLMMACEHRLCMCAYTILKSSLSSNTFFF